MPGDILQYRGERRERYPYLRDRSSKLLEGYRYAGQLEVRDYDSSILNLQLSVLSCLFVFLSSSSCSFFFFFSSTAAAASSTLNLFAYKGIPSFHRLALSQSHNCKSHPLTGSANNLRTWFAARLYPRLVPLVRPSVRLSVLCALPCTLCTSYLSDSPSIGLCLP